MIRSRKTLAGFISFKVFCVLLVRKHAKEGKELFVYKPESTLQWCVFLMKKAHNRCTARAEDIWTSLMHVS